MLDDAVELTVPDPDRLFERVVLGQEVVRPRLGPVFARDGETWRLRFPRPDADRLEYLVEIDGRLAVDPGNQRRAPGPFGDKSVVEWPSYRAPAWLGSTGEEGAIEALELRCRRLGGRVQGLLYATPERPGAGAPLLVVHDGPEYAAYAGLTRFLDAMSRDGRIRPLWAALLRPVDRNEIYSASAVYAAALARELLPGLSEQVDHGGRIGMGASLGALALLHAHHRHPRSFDGLLLQSGSFFRQRWDKVESGFPRYGRITRFVGKVLRSAGETRPIPVVITCGTAEENRANNRAVAVALERGGYPLRYVDVRDAHNWTCWRDAFDPSLPALMEAVG